MEDSLVENAAPLGESTNQSIELSNTSPPSTSTNNSNDDASKNPSQSKDIYSEINITPGEWRFPNPIFGCLYISHLFVSGIFGAIVLTLPSLLILPFFPKIFRKWNDFVASSWFVFVVVHFEWFLGVTVEVFSEDNLDLFKEENALIICNHRTSFDWKYLWSVLFRYGRIVNEKIFLKDTLKWVPGWGWAMQFFCFLFLHRKWEDDEVHIGQILKYFEDTNYPVQLLLFPEGTDFYPNSVKASRKFAKANGLQPYHQVLHPRVRGFSYAVQTARPSIHAVYDFTIAYPDVIPQPEGTVFLGQLPRKVQVLIKRHPIKSLPEETESLDEWCRQCFQNKETLLCNYYNSNERTFMAPLIQYASSSSTTSSPFPSIKKLNLHLTMIACFLMWVFVEIVGIYFLIFNFTVQIYFASACFFFLVETYSFGGIQYAELALHFFKNPMKGEIEREREREGEITTTTTTTTTTTEFSLSSIKVSPEVRNSSISSSLENKNGEIGPDIV